MYPDDIRAKIAIKMTQIDNHSKAVVLKSIANILKTKESKLNKNNLY